MAPMTKQNELGISSERTRRNPARMARTIKAIRIEIIGASPRCVVIGAGLSRRSHLLAGVALRSPAYLWQRPGTYCWLMQMAGADPGMAVYPVPPSKHFIASASRRVLATALPPSVLRQATLFVALWIYRQSGAVPASTHPRPDVWVLACNGL